MLIQIPAHKARMVPRDASCVKKLPRYVAPFWSTGAWTVAITYRVGTLPKRR